MLDTFRCPSCHASLDLPDRPKPAVSCPYCGTTVIIPDELLPAEQTGEHGRRHAQQMLDATTQIDGLVRKGRKVEAVKLFRETFGVGLREAKEAVDAMERRLSGQPANVTPLAPAARGCRGCRGSMIVLLILMVAGIGAAVYYLANDSDLQETISSAVEETIPRNVLLTGGSALIPGDDGEPSDAVFLMSDAISDESNLAYFDGASHSTLWESEAFQESDTSTDFFILDSLILSFTEDKLGAYRVADGSQLWQISLSDRLAYGCRNCVARYGAHIVALTADGQLQGLSAKDGSLAWQQRVSGTGQTGFLDLGSQLAILNEDADEQMGLEIIDPPTGKLVRRLDPRCDNMPGAARGPGVYEPMILDRVDGSIYFLFGFFDPLCVQKWNYESGEQIWGDFSEIGSVSGSATWLNGSERIYIVTDRSDLWAVDKADGVTTLLFQAEDYELVPLDWGGGILLLKAIRRRGTSREELWAVESGSGEVVWRHVPQADEMLEIESQDVVHLDDPGMWAARLSPQGVHLFQARHQPPRLLLETLNLLDGASGGQMELPLDLEAEIPFWISLMGWPNDGLWLKLDSRQIWSVDPVTADLVKRWP